MLSTARETAWKNAVGVLNLFYSSQMRQMTHHHPQTRRIITPSAPQEISFAERAGSLLCPHKKTVTLMPENCITTAPRSVRMTMTKSVAITR